LTSKDVRLMHRTITKIYSPISEKNTKMVLLMVRINSYYTDMQI